MLLFRCFGIHNFLGFVAISRSFFRMCLDDGKAAGRLERRRERIRTEMFPNLLTCQLSNPDDFVWVNTAQLLRYVSCDDRMQDLLECRNGRTLLQHHELLCSHEPQGLHPRVARKGKLLPKAAYESYLAGLREEQRAVLGPAAVDENTVSSDCLILPTEHLICVECCRDYESEIAQKLEKVKAIKHLFDLLETKELESFKLDLGMNETWGNACDRYAYTVSKRFITEFRKQVSGLMKKTATAAAEAKACEFESSLVSLLAENVNEGLDGLDLSDFEKRVFGDGPEAVREVAVPNSNITCTCALGDAGLPCCCTSSQ